MSTDMAPTEYYDSEEDTFKGIAVDTFQLLSEYTGLTFSFVPRGNSTELREGIKEGTIDLVASTAYDEKITTQLYLTPTEPYYDNGITIVTNGKKEDYLNCRYSLALASGYPLYSTVARDHGYTDIVLTDSFSECIKMVSSGKVDCTLIPTNSVNCMRDHPSYDKLATYSLPGGLYEFGIGVSQYADPVLVSILNKGIESITQEQRTQLLLNNLTVTGTKLTTLEFLAEHKLEAVLIILFIVLLISIAIIHYSVKLKRMNIRLSKEIKRADAASCAKSEFLSRMSHDMRTPLNAILGFTILASEEEKIDQNTSDYLQKINNSGKYLLGLISDVLDMSRIENGKVELNEEPESLSPFLTEIAENFRIQAEEKNIKLVTDFDDIKVQWIYLDKLRTRQIFSNLLNNAIKFSGENSEIVFKVSNEAVNKSVNHMVCSIKDQGIGMSQSFIEKMYSPFEQENTDNAVNGTGLGLPIVKSLVNIMRGTINVESTVGKGTTFTIEMDRRTAFAQNKEMKKIQIDDYGVLSGKHVLLCEDHPVNVEIAKKILNKVGITCDLAANGKIGVTMFQLSQISSYDAILMDIRMPVMGGLEATQIIRSLDRADATTIPIIAMTANAYQEDRKKSKEAGMNAHLAKPIEPSLLYQTMIELMECSKN